MPSERLLYPIRVDAFERYDDTWDTPDHSGNEIQMLSFHCLSMVINLHVTVLDPAKTLHDEVEKKTENSWSNEV